MKKQECEFCTRTDEIILEHDVDGISCVTEIVKHDQKYYLRLSDYAWDGYDEEPIAYCPFCGRKL